MWYMLSLLFEPCLSWPLGVVVVTSAPRPAAWDTRWGHFWSEGFLWAWLHCQGWVYASVDGGLTMCACWVSCASMSCKWSCWRCCSCSVSALLSAASIVERMKECLVKHAVKQDLKVLCVCVYVCCVLCVHVCVCVVCGACVCACVCVCVCVCVHYFISKIVNVPKYCV